MGKQKASPADVLVYFIQGVITSGGALARIFERGDILAVMPVFAALLPP